MLRPVSKWYLSNGDYLKKYMTLSDLTELSAAESGYWAGLTKICPYINNVSTNKQVYVNKSKLTATTLEYSGYIGKQSVETVYNSLRAAVTAMNSDASTALNAVGNNHNYFQISNLNVTVNTSTIGESQKLIRGSQFLYFFSDLNLNDSINITCSEIEQGRDRYLTFGSSESINYFVYPSSVSMSLRVENIGEPGHASISEQIISAINTVTGNSYSYSYSYGTSNVAYIYSYNIYNKSVIEYLNDRGTEDYLAQSSSFIGGVPNSQSESNSFIAQGIYQNDNHDLYISITESTRQILWSILSDYPELVQYLHDDWSISMIYNYGEGINVRNPEATLDLYIQIIDINVTYSSPNVLLLQCKRYSSSEWCARQFAPLVDSFKFNVSQSSQYSYNPSYIYVNGAPINTGSTVQITANMYGGSTTNLPAYMIVNYNSVSNDA